MHIFLSYAKSHIYDIHAALVAVITITIMNYIKGPIKRKNRKRIDERIVANNLPENKCRLYFKRANFILLPLTMVLAFLLFLLAAILSPMVYFSLESAVMSGVYALAGYAFWEQVTFDVRREE